MKREYYSDSLQKFLIESNDEILGRLLINDMFETTDLQKNSWKSEIRILKKELKSFSTGDIIFEYTIPRMGSRIDVTCIINGIIFLLEFKVGDGKYSVSAKDQVMDYALDLKYFHQKSKARYIVPIVVATEAIEVGFDLSFTKDNVSNVLLCNKDNIGSYISLVLNKYCDNKLSKEEWINSQYSPTPTIIEAAQALYRSHSVKDISRSDAGSDNLLKTTKIINEIIDTCKANKEKAICFITGVPGAGKTLAGLNIANIRHDFEEEEHAVFLSGNGPLVDVLQEALAQDKTKRTGEKLSSTRRQTKSFIQIIHKFRDDALNTDLAPIEKVVIFDEAQRAWDLENLSDFMKRKKGYSEFNLSEPDFIISIMDRHSDWATIICLVGGGQEIYKGEAGIVNWFEVLKVKYSNWKIYLSDKMTGDEYVGKYTIEELLGNRHYAIFNELHLGTSIRSFRSENLSSFIKALLDNESEEATRLYNKLKDTYPIVLTRDIKNAKEWVKSMARGSERYGLMASSEGKRLRANGIWVPADIDHVAWFLKGKDNVNSSYYLEVAASEFKVQGLEVDYGILAWDADFRYHDGMFYYHRFLGTNGWCNIHSEQKKIYLKNAYRVLLSRARQGLVIYVPDGNDEDPTTSCCLYDGIYNYFKCIGIEEI